MTTINVGTAYSTYQLRHEQFDAGVDAIEAGYRRLAALTKQPLVPNMPAPRITPELDRAAGAAQKAARAQQQLADSEVRAARAMGDYDRALELVNQELAKTEQNTVRYNNLLTQQAAISKQAARAATPSGGPGVAGMAVGALAGVAVVQQVGQQVAQMVELGTQVNRASASFERLAKEAGTSGDAILTTLRAASGGEIDDLNLKLAANRAQLLGVADSADEFSRLMIVARNRAQDMGISTAQAFNDIVTGLGRGSPLILDNLGITVKLSEANEAYAKSLNKTTAQLTEAEKKQALINAVLGEGVPKVTAADNAYAALGVTIENTYQKIAAGVATSLEPAARGLTRVLTGEVGDAWTSFKNNVNEFGDLFRNALPSTAFNPMLAGVIALDQLTIKQREATQAATDAAAATQNQTTATQAQVSADEAAAAAKAEALQKTIDAQIEAQNLADDQAQLASDSALAANGLLGAGDQADILAAKYGITADAAQFLIDKQKALAGRGVDPKRADAEFERPGQAQKELVGVRQAARQASIKEAQDAFAAGRAQQLALASPAERLKLEQQALQRLKPGTAEYINQQTKVLQQQQQIAESATRTTRTAAAGRRAAADDTRTALRQTQTDYADHYRKLQEMQADFELSSSRSQEDFAISQRRLLADGRIKEAQLAKEDFDREQRRKEEDFLRARQREGGGAMAALSGARPQPTGGAMAAMAGAPTAAPAAAQNVIRVEIPIAVTMDGQQIATITGPFITQPLLDNLALQIGITTAGRPIGGQQQAFREIA